jgi:16S rRNA (adenine1518-N6/adenine1519-N6)-dimethyltransferase
MKLSPKKSLGQNFLHDPKILDKIATAGNLKYDDVVLEVGPGTGNLTRLLAPKVQKVIAIEKDARAIEGLNIMFKNSNVEIVEGDVMKFNPSDLGLLSGNYKIVANIPYYITSNFLRIALENWPRPELIVLTVQNEVAQRIVSRPPKMNLLALSVQYYAEAEIVGKISAGSFFPKPEVDSAIIRLVPKESPLSPNETKEYFALLKSCFAEKRKQMAKVLGQKLDISKEKVGETLVHLGIRPDARPEILSQEQWLSLFHSLEE